VRALEKLTQDIAMDISHVTTTILPKENAKSLFTEDVVGMVTIGKLWKNVKHLAILV
jgi:hypothetical protein